MSEEREYLTDSMGRLVPRDKVKEIDLLRDEVVIQIADRALAVSRALGVLKRHLLDDIKAFEQLSAEKYGLHIGGSKGNVTLSSYNGRVRVMRQVQGRIAFDERLAIAKALIDRCIERWTVGVNNNVRALVEHAFQADRQGKVSTERVLGLRRLRIEDEEWKRAMAAIADSITVTSTSTYVRIYTRRDETDQWEPIPLDLAQVEAINEGQTEEQGQ
jgi:hypothetical protein